MRVALLGFGNVGRALARLLGSRRPAWPFQIAGIHTARHGTALDPAGLSADPPFGPAAASVEEFLDRAGAEVLVELTPLDPVSGEPAISHIRAAFARGMHVVTANKGPIAHAYAELRDEAERAGVLFRFEATCMDGAPVYNMVRRTLPGVRVLGFTGVLNSTTQVVIEAMRQGRSMQDGIDAARRLGITEADAAYDIDGWDSAAKTAALANVLLDARTTPQQVDTRGIGRLTPERLMELATRRKTVRLVSRARCTPNGLRLRVRAEVLDETDILASLQGTSNLLLFHTDLMGTVGTISISPGVDQTAYGVFSDLVDISGAGSHAGKTAGMAGLVARATLRDKLAVDMAHGFWSGLRRFVMWDYHRGTWQYDVMVALILGFIFLTPVDWFRDRPRPANIVMIEGHAGSDVWIAPELLAGVPEAQQLGKATSLVQNKFGKGITVVRVQTILDPESEVTGYMVQVQP